MKHKFAVGQEVRLAGQQIKFSGMGTKNKFAWNLTGVVEELGWSKPVKIEKGYWSERAADGSRRRLYTAEVVQLPMYKIGGKWYAPDQVDKV